MTSSATTKMMMMTVDHAMTVSMIRRRRSQLVDFPGNSDSGFKFYPALFSYVVEKGLGAV
jgi:hypothetical protein